MKKRTTEEVKSYFAGEIENLCYMVDKEVKPCALSGFSIMFDDEKNIDTIDRTPLYKIENYIKNHYPNLKFYTKEVVTTNSKNKKELHFKVYIYKYPHLENVIKNIPKEPKDVRHWYMGKLFGYSDNMIEEFLNRQSKDD
jgi:hypothetical protein